MTDKTQTADRAMSILRWIGGGDTGISSVVLALAACGIIGDRWGNCEPGDENDSGRCERLARSCPFVVDALPGLIERNQGWEKWADRIRSAVHDE
jgi:hypothetical protein